MDRKCRLINECLLELRQRNVVAKKKLRLEVQLFQIKLLLLSESVSEEIKGRYCSEIVLQEMYHLMVGLNGCEENGAAIEGISHRLKTIATDLAGGRC